MPRPISCCSVIIPAYNCAATVSHSIRSVIEGNADVAKEIVIVDDGSTDVTEHHLLRWKHNSSVRIIRHDVNLGGGAARNTAVKNVRHEWVFCLDSDNILPRGSLARLVHAANAGLGDVVSFAELHYFRRLTNLVTHKWVFKSGEIRLSDYLASPIVPGAGGNYLFSMNSWEIAGGYPENKGALDTWVFGLRQVAAGARMWVEEGTFYYHRYGHKSYWVRHSEMENLSEVAFAEVAALADRLDLNDLERLSDPAARRRWIEMLAEHPIHVRGENAPASGGVSVRSSLLLRLIGRL